MVAMLRHGVSRFDIAVMLCMPPALAQHELGNLFRREKMRMVAVVVVVQDDPQPAERLKHQERQQAQEGNEPPKSESASVSGCCAENHRDHYSDSAGAGQVKIENLALW